MNRLILLRHGENQANLTKELSCRKIDYPLNDKGRLQAFQTGAFLQDKGIDVIFTSPLKRAYETATIVGEFLKMKPILHDAFREVNVGALEDRPPTKETWDVHNAVIQDWAEGKHDSALSEGENFHQLWERYRQGLFEVCHAFPRQTILIVGHGGIFTFTLPNLCPEVTRASFLTLKNHNTSLSEIQVRFEGRRPIGHLIQWASTEHLSGHAANLVSGLPEPGHKF